MTPLSDLTALPPASLEDKLHGMTALVGRANAVLSRYDGLLESVPNPEVLLSPLVTVEAEQSSRIEGTVATANEVFEAEAGAEFGPEKRADIEEILNYRHTLRLATTATRDQPISLQLIRTMHEELMKGVRGQDKSPGRFRSAQNWIGPKGCALEAATYVPPSPLRLNDHLQEFESFIQARHQDIDPIVKTALIHAQFELIHPFDDGNGRIGRLLIPLHLAQTGSLVVPSLYISAYFEKNREAYIARLAGISESGDWRSWIQFFLDAVITQSGENLATVREILALYEGMKPEFARLTHSEQSIGILDMLFNRPVFRASEMHEVLGIQRQRAAGYIRALKDAGILTEVSPSSGRTAAIMSFDALLRITNKS